MSTRRIFVGNLSFSTTEARLQQYFQDVGPVVAVHIALDAATGKSRGFGFVEYGSEEEARMAIEVFDGRRFGGRNIHVRPANLESRRPGRPTRTRREARHWETEESDRDYDYEPRDHKPRRDWREMRRSKRSF